MTARPSTPPREEVVVCGGGWHRPCLALSPALRWRRWQGKGWTPRTQGRSLLSPLTEITLYYPITNSLLDIVGLFDPLMFINGGVGGVV